MVLEKQNSQNVNVEDDDADDDDDDAATDYNKLNEEEDFKKD